jgi:hypothetical protein
MFKFKNAVEVPMTLKVYIQVKCVSNPLLKKKLTLGKIYTITELSILRQHRCRVKCDTGRNVWYDINLFCKL